MNLSSMKWIPVCELKSGSIYMKASNGFAPRVLLHLSREDDEVELTWLHVEEDGSTSIRVWPYRKDRLVLVME